jgi:nucleoside-diphosphate-sugar epimerase
MKILVTGGAGYIGRIQPEEVHAYALTVVD